MKKCISLSGSDEICMNKLQKYWENQKIRIQGHLQLWEREESLCQQIQFLYGKDPVQQS